MSAGPTPSAILDFADEPGAPTRRLRFERPIAVWRTNSHDEIVALLDRVDRAARDGSWLVGFVSYEAASGFDSAFDSAPPTALPLAWFARFDAPAEEPPAAFHEAQDEGEGSSRLSEPVTVVTSDGYRSGIARIHAHIEAGDVYQVNLTVPYTAAASDSPVAIYELLRRAQGGAYSCFLDLGDAQILSASPELLFERRGALVRSRPMKGTAPRGLHPRADAAARDRLRRSEKDRAENVMIVDVVRNDLGRIAQVGSVRVTDLCELERYPSVWQLTSTVEAEVDPALSLASVFGALFPPASVTGAPKISATRIIRALEQAPRGVYCGSIGVVRPGGDATFNVAIRTGWMAADSGVLRLAAGGGVTADSTARGELLEVDTKLRAFTRPCSTPALFETIRVERGIAVRVDRHLRRLGASAAYFGIPFDASHARVTLESAIAATSWTPVARARIDLSPSGALSAAVRSFEDVVRDAPALVAMASRPVDARDVRLYHKCANRTVYDAALAAAPGMFDVVLWNAAGEVTELTRGNLIVELDGRRLTPPVDSGLLAGILREELLERGDVQEERLTLADVHRAQRLWFVNALRGWVPIQLAREEASDGESVFAQSSAVARSSAPSDSAPPSA